MRLPVNALGDAVQSNNVPYFKYHLTNPFSMHFGFVWQPCPPSKRRPGGQSMSTRGKGLSSTAAIVIVARRLARTAWSMCTYKTEFDPGRLMKSLT